MRKILCLCLTLILCLTLASVLAVDGLSFNECCKNKTNRGVTLYQNVDGTLYEAGYLPAGTYLKKLGGDSITAAHADLAHIEYSPDNDGSYVIGYIEKGAISSATASYTLKSGKTVTIPEALLWNKSALNFYINMEYGEKADDDVVITPPPTTGPSGDDPTPTPESGLSDAEWYARMAKAAQANGAYTPTSWTDETGNTVDVTVTDLGLARTKVKIGKETKVVPTTELTWETEVDSKKILAVINAQKQGYASLRTKSSSKATIMDHCITNSVVRVIKYGKNWCLVDYRGTRGYVQTSTLLFRANDTTEYQTGVLSYKGRTYSKNGTTTVNLRAKAVNGSRILESVVVGEPVTVIATEGKWSEVDCKGYHCYVLSEYITLDQE